MKRYRRRRIASRLVEHIDASNASLGGEASGQPHDTVVGSCCPLMRMFEMSSVPPRRLYAEHIRQRSGKRETGIQVFVRRRCGLLRGPVAGWRLRLDKGRVAAQRQEPFWGRDRAVRSIKGAGRVFAVRCSAHGFHSALSHHARLLACEYLIGGRVHVGALQAEHRHQPALRNGRGVL